MFLLLLLLLLPLTLVRDFERPLAAELAVKSYCWLRTAGFLDIVVVMLVLVFYGARSSGLSTSLSLESTKVN